MGARGPNVDLQTRGAIAALTILGDQENQLSDVKISEILGVPRATIGEIKRGILAKVNTNGGSPLEDENINPKKGSGRAPLLTERDIRHLILTATRNRVQRAKPWSQVSHEAALPNTSLQTISRALRSKGYDRHVPAGKLKLAPEEPVAP